MKNKLFICCLLLAILPLLVFSQTKTLLLKDELEKNFLNPPASAKPYVYWHWMGSNFSKSGITKDLEAMKEEGIGGATIYNLSSSSPTLENQPWPEQTYRSPAYWEALRFAAAEAKRLGLELGLHNSVGYSGTGGPWIKQEQGMQKIVWSSVNVEGGQTVSLNMPRPQLPTEEGYGGTFRKATYYKDFAILAVPEADSFGLKDVINLTEMTENDGSVKWDAPKGNWKVYRFGNSPTMTSPHPIPDELIGKAFEVDKMSKELNEYHWHVVIDSIKKYLGEYVGKSFTHLFIDSYEAGYQNWTANFREEFIKLKGYDPIPWLVCFGKPITNSKEKSLRKVINSEEETKRFEWDYADVINRLYFDNGWTIGKKICHENNLMLHWEPYAGPFDIVEGDALADIPVATFWASGPFSSKVYKGNVNSLVPAAARAAGKTLVAAESFTGWPTDSKYTEDPAFLKPISDGAFASGVNRLMLHHWVHQPFDDKYQPGMEMFFWGTHFGRHQTWFEPGKAYFSYLARAQTMLQFGEQIADYICIDKQDGFSDVIATHDFLLENIKVENHQIILPSGRKYAFIDIPKGDTLLPAVVEKIKKLVDEGAFLVSPKPKASPSLQDYPNADNKIKAIAAEVWGNGTDHNYGKGWVTNSVANAIEKCHLTADCIIEKAEAVKHIKYAHRQKDNTHIFYIANTDTKPENVTLSFRVTGLQPEIWQAEDGSITLAPVWKEEGGRTHVQLFLKGIQTAFVVFRKPVIQTIHATSVVCNATTADCKLAFSDHIPSFIAYKDVKVTVALSNGKEHKIDIKPAPTEDVTGSWHVIFNPKLSKQFELDFPELLDFNKSDNRDVKYFSGTAHYSKTITITADELSKGKRVMLDLGTVNDIVQLTVNQKDLGVLWYPPYKTDITTALKVGENKLDIAVTNNWANRLIGDEQEPKDFVTTKERSMMGDTFGIPLKAYPDWFIKNQPRPSQGRKTFTTFYYHKKDSPLQPAGLAGPIRLQFGEEVGL